MTYLGTDPARRCFTSVNLETPIFQYDMTVSLYTMEYKIQEILQNVEKREEIPKH